MEIGKKIANTRKELGITQVELADKMAVTRQTVSRWESGAALPDVEKVFQIATILNVSCDYLLKDEVEKTGEEKTNNNSAVTRLFQNLVGKNVKISFYDDEEDYELLDKVCKVEEIEEMATHSSFLAWRIPGMGEPGGLPSMGSHRVGHD